MSKQMILDLPDNLYERVQQVAQAEREDAINVVLRLLDEALPHALPHTVEQSWSEPDEAVEREMHAYVTMHSILKEKYFGKYVAVYGGKLIDVDDSYDELFDRIDDHYPDTFVWMSKVEEEALPTLVFRSPRLIQNA